MNGYMNPNWMGQPMNQPGNDWVSQHQMPPMQQGGQGFFSDLLDSWGKRLGERAQGGGDRSLVSLGMTQGQPPNMSQFASMGGLAQMMGQQQQPAMGQPAPLSNLSPQQFLAFIRGYA